MSKFPVDGHVLVGRQAVGNRQVRRSQAPYVSRRSYQQEIKSPLNIHLYVTFPYFPMVLIKISLTHHMFFKPDSTVHGQFRTYTVLLQVSAKKNPNCQIGPRLKNPKPPSTLQVITMWGLVYDSKVGGH